MSQPKPGQTATLLAIMAILALILASPAPPLAADEEEPTPTATALPKVTATPRPTPAEVAAEGSEESDGAAQPSGSTIYPLAVMVDNFPNARPQSGLEAASIVYEALAEGGITRFLAIYADGDPELVGPIRSARHYYVYWAAEYNAPLVHIMASDAGYAALVNTGLLDLDEHRGDPGFLRVDSRPIPYNAYASPAFARALLRDHGAYWPGSLGPFERQEPTRAVRGRRATNLKLVYPLADFTVDWSYESSTGRYLRSQAGAPHLDAASSQQIGASSVVVQFMPAWVAEVVGGEAYLDMELTRTGRAVYFQGGLAVEGTWSRDSLGSVTRYLDADGEAVTFPPGPVWVQIVPTGPLEGTLTYESSQSIRISSGPVVSCRGPGDGRTPTRC